MLDGEDEDVVVTPTTLDVEIGRLEVGSEDEVVVLLEYGVVELELEMIDDEVEPMLLEPELLEALEPEALELDVG